MNPELRRYVWTELTPQRLGLAIVFVGLAFTVAWWTEPSDFVFVAWALYALAILWSTLLAANAVSGEVAARTWDGQRLSAMSAGGIVLGKLFGAGALPTLVAVVASIALVGVGQPLGPDRPGLSFIALIGAAFCAQAVAIFLDCAGVARSAGDRRTLFGGAARTVGALAIMLALATGMLADSDFELFIRADIAGIPLDPTTHAVATLWLYTLWAVAGAWAVTRRGLGYRRGPGVWLAFVLFVSLIHGGFRMIDADPTLIEGAMSRALAAGLAGVALAYVAAFAADRDIARYRGWLSAIGRGDITGAWRGSPAWPYPLIIALAAAGAVFILDDATVASASSDGFAPHAFISAVAATAARDVIGVVLIGLLFRRRAPLIAVAALLIAHLLTPTLIGLLGAPDWAPALLSPRPFAPAWTALAPALTAAALLALLARRALRPAQTPT